MKTLKEISQASGVPHVTLHYRVQRLKIDGKRCRWPKVTGRLAIRYTPAQVKLMLNGGNRR